MKRITVLVLVTLLSLGSLFQGTGLAVTEATKPDVTCTPGTDYSCAIPLTGPATGAVAHHATVYYSFPAVKGATYLVRLVPTEGDPDLNVRASARSAAGYSNRGGDAVDAVTFTAEQDGDYYVLVYGYQPSTYILSVTTGLSISPSSKTIGLNTSTHVIALATAGDDHTLDVSDVASWSTSDPKVATVSGGRIIGVATGTATITASHGGYSATVIIAVDPVVALTVTPASMVMKTSFDKHLSATATFSNGAKADVSADASWSSDDAAVIAADSKGKGYVYAHSVGTATITAAYGGVNGSTPVTAIDVTSVTLTPSAAKVGAGQGQQMTLTAHHSAGSVDVTAWSKWSTDDPAIATLTENGRVDGVAGGTITVTGDFDGYKAQAPVHVECASGSHIACPLTLSKSATGNAKADQRVYYQFSATAGSTYEVTLSSSSGDADLDVYNPDRSQLDYSYGSGLERVMFTPSATGKYYAVVKGFSAAAYTLSVTPLTVSSVTVSPTPVLVVTGDSRQLTASATYSNKEGADVTSSTTWSTSDESVATVSNTGVVTGVAPGTATITGVYGGKSAPVAVTVKTLSKLSVLPSSLKLKTDEHKNLTALAVYADGTSEDVTSTASWRSNHSDIAAGLVDGYVSAYMDGTATITATYGGRTASSTVTVSGVSSWMVTPACPTMSKGETVQLTVTANWTDGSSMTVTATKWESLDPAIATVSSSGLVTGVAAGTAIIGASYGGGSRPTFVTVTDVNGVAVSPSPNPYAPCVGTAGGPINGR